MGAKAGIVYLKADPDFFHSSSFAISLSDNLLKELSTAETLGAYFSSRCKYDSSLKQKTKIESTFGRSLIYSISSSAPLPAVITK